MHASITAVLTGRRAQFGAGTSAIHKTPRDGRVAVTELGLDGDEHAYHGHGGPEKALLHYDSAHYVRWRETFPHSAALAAATAGGAIPAVDGAATDAPTTLFGENLIGGALSESTVSIGDRFRIGERVVLEVTQPRQPCWKLGRFADAPELPEQMQSTASTGWYYRVIEPGDIGAGDAIVREASPHPEWTVARVIEVLYLTPRDWAATDALVALAPLGQEIREVLVKRRETGRIEGWRRRLFG